MHVAAMPNVWISLREAARLIDVHPDRLKVIAHRGGVRVCAVPGARVTYHRDDLLKLIEDSIVPAPAPAAAV